LPTLEGRIEGEWAALSSEEPASLAEESDAGPEKDDGNASSWVTL
jgi:hypothetical protein